MSDGLETSVPRRGCTASPRGRDAGAHPGKRDPGTGNPTLKGQGFQGAKPRDFCSSGLKGHSFPQPGLKALDIGVLRDWRAESPAIRWGLSLGEFSNGQPVGPLDSSKPGARAYSPGYVKDRPFGPEEATIAEISQCSAPWKPCPFGVPGGVLSDTPHTYFRA